jgi:hypothetical protein
MRTNKSGKEENRKGLTGDANPFSCLPAFLIHQLTTPGFLASRLI